MITIRRSQQRGHADHGWLDARHTFSFAEYRDPNWTRFGLLRVLNQDRIRPGQGFGTHGHEDMEIVTWILEGELAHRDSMGTGTRLRPGDVQVMSAGSGLTHSEFNGSETEELHLLQMWVFPRERGTTPRYGESHVPLAERRGRLRQVASPDGADGSLTVGQDARAFVGLFHGDETDELALASDRAAWLHAARGSLELNGQRLHAGDGAGVVDESALHLGAGDDAECVVWELPRP
jgi:hypothetical protein